VLSFRWTCDGNLDCFWLFALQIYVPGLKTTKENWHELICVGFSMLLGWIGAAHVLNQKHSQRSINWSILQRYLTTFSREYCNTYIIKPRWVSFLSVVSVHRHSLDRFLSPRIYLPQYSNSTGRIPEFPIEPEIALELLIAAKYLDTWASSCVGLDRVRSVLSISWKARFCRGLRAISFDLVYELNL